MFPGLDLYCTDLPQHLKTAGEDLDDLDRDLFDIYIHSWGYNVLPCGL